jgi:hypothetical protein
MQHELPSPRVRTDTVFAVRNRVARGWRMIAWECDRKDLQRRLAESEINGLEYRFVGTAEVPRQLERRFAFRRDGWVDRFVIERALKAGWHQDLESAAWFPIDEPLSRLPGAPVQRYASLSLKSIMYGAIGIAVEADGKELDLWIDDVGDSLVLFVRFVQILAAGGEPHAALADRATAHFIVQNGPHPHLCRIHVEVRSDGEPQVIDVMTDRDELIQQFRSLSTAIADHAWFAHHYFCYCCLPDAEYERASRAAELEWERSVKEVRVLDDCNAREEFVAARIANGVPLPDDCARLAEEGREMLRSLQIPKEWLLSHGFVGEPLDTPNMSAS